MTAPAQPPLAPKRPRMLTQHGDSRVDDYFWLRDRDDPDVLSYLAAENDYAAQRMAHTQALQLQLFAEMRARVKEDDCSAPERRGEYFYYTRTEAGSQYAIHCRKRASLDAPEEVLLDENALAAGRDFCKLGVFEPSPDHRRLVFSVDYEGAEQHLLCVKDLRTGQLLPEQILNTYANPYDHSGVEWANDNGTFFYSVLDGANRSYQVYRHVVGTDPAQDVLVYHETDEAYMVVVRKSRSQAYLLLTLHNNTTSEVRYAPADLPQADFNVVQPRQAEVEYFVEHHGEHFLIVTNDQAKNFRLVAAPVSTPGKEHWRELLPERSDVLLEGLDAFKDYLVLYERSSGQKRIRLSEPDGQNPRYVSFPEAVYTFWPGSNPEFDTHTLRFMYTSVVTPDSIVDYHMDVGLWELKKRQEIPSGYDPLCYQAERLTATAPDGAPVLISLAYRIDLRRAGGNPLLLHGYGAYGYGVEPMFSAARLSLLDRGVIYAIAHVRGGSDYGRDWYERGKLLHKKNTFSDFIACAEHLIAQGYTTPEQLGIMGVSAGGLLMGAVTTLRPELFKAVIAKVPFVDVINTMNDPSIPLTVTEWEEWGNPAIPEQYAYMRSYSPYDNTRATAYPHLLITAGLNDPRVAYWEPAKWAAKLRALKTDDNVLLLKTNMDAGHAGASGRFDYLKEIAFEYAFLLDRLGVAESET
jgi:oligopeptidase B